MNVGADALHWIIFGCCHLFHSGSMNEIVDPTRRFDQPLAITHVADQPANAGRVYFLLHLELLELIARIENEARQVVAFEQYIRKFAPEGARTAGNKHGFAVEHLDLSLPGNGVTEVRAMSMTGQSDSINEAASGGGLAKISLLRGLNSFSSRGSS